MYIPHKYIERAMTTKRAGNYRNPQFNLRIPQNLKDWLFNEAVDENRSVNSEILHILERYRHEQEMKSA